MFLETDRLILKKYNITDLEDYFQLKSCNEIWKFSTNVPIKDRNIVKNQLLELIEKQIEVDLGFCSLIEKSSNLYIGEAGILSINNITKRCVVGYNLLPEFWNKGYATEITKELLKYAFVTLSLERVEALALQVNIASCKVLEKSGFSKEGILRHFTKIDGLYYDVCYYGIIKSDFFGK